MRGGRRHDFVVQLFTLAGDSFLILANNARAGLANFDYPSRQTGRTLTRIATAPEMPEVPFVARIPCSEKNHHRRIFACSINQCAYLFIKCAINLVASWGRVIAKLAIPLWR
jgi:hypothetical protein